MRFAKRRFLSFVDILGFTEMVGHGTDDLSLGLAVEQAVAEALYWVRGCKPHPTGDYAWRFRSFSDCLMFSQPETCLGLLNMFEAVAYLIRRMIMRRLPVRGGIALDHHVQFQLTIPSKALAAAYSLEHSTEYPRVEIAPGVVEAVIMAEDLVPELSEYVAFDSNGTAFLNYLVSDNDDDLHWNLRYLHWQRSFLKERLDTYEMTEKVRRKYFWLASFHDWCVRSSPMATEEDNWIALDELLVGRGDEKYRFVSLQHLLLIFSVRTERDDPIDWNELMLPSVWPFNHGHRLEGQFCELAKIIRPLVDSRRWTQITLTVE